MSELSRTYRIDTLGEAPRAVSLAAEEKERAALAERFALLAVERLSAEAALTRTGETVVAAGTLSAAVVQACVATGEPVPAQVEESFRIEFRPHPDTGPEEEVELSEGELDTVFYEGGAVDVGEAVAETLGLALDPYPRSAAAERALREAGVRSEEEAREESSPFAALKGLRDKLGG
jgi:uncharacterized metal-binding protein YceD (DUF177 family)